jgi:hypothetical protein
MEIGPDGGQFSFGNYTLSVPPGALATSVRLSITQENNGQWPVRFGPEGTQFAVPVTMTFDASSETNAGSMSVAWWNPSTGQWVDQLTKHDGSLVMTDASHFSKYVIH